MKALLILLLFSCSSFALCDKVVVIDKTHWTLYIYPDCNDTTTYIKQEFELQETRLERKPRSKGWKRSPLRYRVEEGFYSSDTRKSEFTCYYSKSDTSCFGSIYYDKHNYVSIWTKQAQLPGSYTCGDTNNYRDIDIYRNHIGVIESAILKRSRSNVYQRIDWDKAHKSKWKGDGVMVVARIDSVEIDNIFEERMLISASDTFAKIGWWYQYNDIGKLIDSAFYHEPPKIR